MARLTDRDAARLIACLETTGSAATGLGADVAVEFVRPIRSLHDIAKLQERLAAVSIDDRIGPVLTQRLAAYLGKPIRCTSGDAQAQFADGPVYVARTEGAELWLRLDVLLAAALTDAMIGGEGEAAKVGHGADTARAAAGAAREMLSAIALALELPEPVSVSYQSAALPHLKAQLSGTLSVTTRSYPWQAGVGAYSAGERSGKAGASEREPANVEGTTLVVPCANVEGTTLVVPLDAGSRRSDVLDSALEHARLELEGMLGATVRFDGFEYSALGGPRVPPGWLGVGLASRDGGAIVLAANEKAVRALINQALQADVVSALDIGSLVETGAEALLRAALHAFSEVLGSTPDELHHIVRLSGDAILAELSYRSIEHRAAFPDAGGLFHWLVPQGLVHAAHPATGASDTPC